MTSHNRLICALASVLCLGACASDAPGQEGEDENVGELDIEAGGAPVVLATLKISDTREVTFYKLGEHEGMVEEKFDFATDGEPLLKRGDNVKAGNFAAIDRKAAGENPRLKVPKALVDFDKEQGQSAAAQTAAPAPAEPGIAESRELLKSGSTNKGFWSDMQWFSDTYCGSCMGHDGVSAGYAPWGYAACTTVPNYCQAGGGYSSYTIKSDDALIYAFNFADSPSAAKFNVTFPNDCENSGPIFRNCGFLSDHNALVAPGQVVSRHYDATKRWTRRATITGPGNVMLSFDAY